MIVGAALGGIAAYAMTPSRESRAPVTALGLVFPYYLTIAIPYD